ncbi:MAG: chromate efflux transporter [Thermomicrobiales bacterium]
MVETNGQPLTASVGSENLGEVARLALKLGFTAFGGPAAHIAMLREEAVNRRKWLSEAYFLDLIGATNLIPGPNSTEMVMHIGRLRAGWKGLVVAGSLFILPAASIVLLLAWLYVDYGTTPELEWLLYGIKPVIIAVVAQALWGLGKTAIKSPLLAAVAVLALTLYLLGFNEIAILFGGAALIWLIRSFRSVRAPTMSFVPFAGLPLSALLTAQSGGSGVNLTTLFFQFLKIGSVLYGSGYVLLAFLRNDFVIRYEWITDQQLLDAVAIGQFTPGPVFTTATFVGYVAAGFPGAVLATLGIFLPSFLFVAALHPLIPHLRKYPWTSALLDGVNVAAIGLMAAVTLELGRDALVDWQTVAIAIVAAILLIRFKVNSAWLVLGGGILGFVIESVF